MGDLQTDAGRQPYRYRKLCLVFLPLHDILENASCGFHVGSERANRTAYEVKAIMPTPVRTYRFGIFSHLDACVAAIKQLPGEGFREIEVYSPTPDHEIAHALRRKPSSVRVFTLAGGLAGLTAGWAMTIGSTMIYPIVVGGKPVISIPPFGVVAYITTILFGTIATFIGFLINARVPQIKIVEGYDGRLSSDHFGILAYCLPEDVVRLEKLLKKLGAVTVNRSQGL